MTESGATETKLLTEAKEAGQLLKNGRLVAIPTETVYGLAACIGDEAALLRVFSVKGRPGDNPLIVHIAGIKDLPLVCDQIPPQAVRLAEAFWPGPLSLVLKKKRELSDLVTAGRNTVAVRLPDHPLTVAVIEAAGSPLAAPSANLSGRPSPTTAAHVLADLNGRIDAVLDGGACAVCVESTVVDLTVSPARILRPGGVSQERLRAVLGEELAVEATAGPPTVGHPPKSPGMKYRHYAPKAPVKLYQGSSETAIAAIKADLRPGDAVLCFQGEEAQFPCPALPYGPGGDGDALARNLYSALRQLDETPGVLRILARLPEPSGVSAAVANRLCKAAAPSARFLVGLTGPIAAGKSLVCKRWEALGASVVHCDKLYHDMLEYDTRLTAAILARFPCAESNKTLDRKKLADHVFANPQALSDLNAIAHPIVLAELKKRTEPLTGPVVIEAIALFESGLAAFCDATVAVLAPEEVRRRRLEERDRLTAEQIQCRFNAQPNEAFYTQRANHLLHNHGDPAQLTQTAHALWHKITGTIKQ